MSRFKPAAAESLASIAARATANPIPATPAGAIAGLHFRILRPRLPTMLEKPVSRSHWNRNEDEILCLDKQNEQAKTASFEIPDYYEVYRG